MGISRLLRGAKADSNYAWTDWRWMQSAANSSLGEFPLSGKITGTLEMFLMSLSGYSCFIPMNFGAFTGHLFLMALH
jgi:hypothetical protein